MPFSDTTTLRARFAAALSTLYGHEVPAYQTLVEVCHEVNRTVMQHDQGAAERLGSIERVTAERHGAIRVGSPQELRQVAQVFAALGMEPTGFYDLREARPAPIPVVSTAFRPIRRDELAKNPFRVFTSMLVPEDRRFFDADLEARLKAFIDARELFPAELLHLAERAEHDGGLQDDDAARFMDLATAAFALSDEPIDRRWYDELEAVSSVAADIGGVPSLHINHLTPRVLDIDDLYVRMEQRGIAMIDRIQGPPRWQGPDVLLRQTSFRALAEPRRMREPSGEVVEGELRVRFGEVEARGIALTRQGRDLYDSLVGVIDQEASADAEADRDQIAREVWGRGHWPDTEGRLCTSGLGYFTFSLSDQAGDRATAGSLRELIADGTILAHPIVYEDFLPRSAAGIFASNLVGSGSVDEDLAAVQRSADWMSEALGRTVHDPHDLYHAESSSSLTRVGAQLGLDLQLAELFATGATPSS